MRFKSDHNNILLPEFAPEGRRCLNCKFYYRDMSSWGAVCIKRNFENEDIYLEYQYGEEILYKKQLFHIF